MEVFLQFDDRADLTLNDSIAGQIQRKGETLEYEAERGAPLAKYEVIDVISRVDFRGILSRVQIILRRT